MEFSQKCVTLVLRAVVYPPTSKTKTMFARRKSNEKYRVARVEKSVISVLGSAAGNGEAPAKGYGGYGHYQACARVNRGGIFSKCGRLDEESCVDLLRSNELVVPN